MTFIFNIGTNSEYSLRKKVKNKNIIVEKNVIVLLIFLKVTI